MAAANGLETLSAHRCFGGTVGYYRHRSAVNDCAMRFAVYTPPAASRGPVPVLTWLAGLTCTEETFMIKAGAQRVAAELGLMLVAPDTSPRGAGVPDAEDGAWDLGLGAGFYLDATEPPWSSHYRMHSYLATELPGVIAGAFPADMRRQGIFGHSMGGHGALVMALRNPGRYASVSAFAPIAAPSQCPWGEKAFTAYLGMDRGAWADWDATELVRRAGVGAGPRRSSSTRASTTSSSLPSCTRRPSRRPARRSARRSSCAATRLRPRLLFISSFIEDHLRHHAALLAGHE
jgi:S-formylglutathione hydrolase